jgi:hypothetical protein
LEAIGGNIIIANDTIIVGEFMDDGIKLRELHHLVGACVMAYVLGFGLRNFIIWYDLS